MEYLLQVQLEWMHPQAVPLVFIRHPPLRPRQSEEFIDLPHLQFNSTRPEDSALCLYHPAANEWNNTMLIADTVLPWASEWLLHYELWHLDGVWRGKSASGPQTVREILATREVNHGSR